MRTYVYRSFAGEAKAVTPEEIADALAISATEALSALRELHQAHLVVLDSSLSRIVMAHPWAASFMGFVVASDIQKWWGGCAWDSFAIPAWRISSFRSTNVGRRDLHVQQPAVVLS